MTDRNKSDTSRSKDQWFEPTPPTRWRRQSIKQNEEGRPSGGLSRVYEEQPSRTAAMKYLLREFTQYTSLHGIRFTTIRTNFTSRRVLWSLAVTAAVVYFLFYFADRLIEYFKYVRTTSVLESYVDEMEYPAITICNQNAFKLTAAVRGGWYDKVKNILQANSIPTIGIVCSGVSNFTCGTGTCIDTRKRCDLFCDCSDCSDEINCEPCPRIHVSSNSATPNNISLFGVDYILHSKNQEKPTYMKMVESDEYSSGVFYIRYDQNISKWVFSDRKQGGTVHASTSTTTSEMYPQHLTMDWILHNDSSTAAITFTCLNPIQIEYSLSKLATTPKSNVSLEEMYIDGAHDMLDGAVCAWKNKPCSLVDFHRLFTDSGLCYTFLKETMTVENSGPGNGLHLEINIETYDYTQDLSSGVGIKVLMHDPSEVPLMAEKGLAVSPGLRSFIGMERVELKGLEPPWGNCSAPYLEYYQEYSVSSCKMNCENVKIRELCNCRDVHMPQKGSADRLCTVDEWVSCAKPKLEELRNLGDYCTCAAPCIDIRYIPTLTFASISSNSDALSPAQREENKKFSKILSEARETRYRVDEDKYRRTLRVLFSLSEEFSHMYRFLISAEERLDAEIRRVQDITSLLRADCSKLSTKQHKVVAVFSKALQYSMETYHEYIQNHLHASLQQLEWVWGKSMVQVLNATSQDEEEAQFRNANETIWAHIATLPSMFEVVRHDMLDDIKQLVQNMVIDKDYKLLKERISYIDQQMLASCDWCFDNNLAEIVQDKLLTFITSTLPNKINASNTRLTKINEEYINGSIIKESGVNNDTDETANCTTGNNSTEMNNCTASIENVNCTTENNTEANCTNVNNSTAENTGGSTENSTGINSNGTTENCTNASNDTTGYNNCTEDNSTQTDTWQSRINFNWTAIRNDISILVSETKSVAKSVKTNLHDTLTNASTYVSELLQHVNPRCDGELEKLYNEYADVHERLKIVFTGFHNEILKRNDTFNTHRTKYENLTVSLGELASVTEIQSLVHYVEAEKLLVESLVYNLKCTVLRLERHIGHTEFWFMAQFSDTYLKAESVYWKYFQLESPELEYLESSYNDLKSKPMMTDSVIKQWWNSLRDTIDEVINELNERGTALDKILRTADAYLQDFLLGNTIDETFVKTNFLHLDIFYKELLEKKITQLKSFDLPALLGEIGGMMGLMLGCSVLTICEVIDLLIYNMLCGLLRRK